MKLVLKNVDLEFKSKRVYDFTELGKYSLNQGSTTGICNIKATPLDGNYLYYFSVENGEQFRMTVNNTGTGSPIIRHCFTDSFPANGTDNGYKYAVTQYGQGITIENYTATHDGYFCITCAPTMFGYVSVE